MKVTLRVPKFAPGVRTNLPDYSSSSADADVPEQTPREPPVLPGRHDRTARR